MLFLTPIRGGLSTLVVTVACTTAWLSFVMGTLIPLSPQKHFGVSGATNDCEGRQDSAKQQLGHEAATVNS